MAHAVDISLEEALILQAFEDDVFSEEEAFLAFQLVSTSNENEPIEHRNYERLDLDRLNETECLERFRFSKQDITRLARALRLPDKFTGYQGTAWNSIEGLCLLLRRLAYPCRYVDLIPLFGRSKAELSIIGNDVLDFIYAEHKHLLNSFVSPWMSERMLGIYCEAVHRKGAALDNCWGFVDWTVSCMDS
jgi:hypothetical protein